MLGNRTGFLPMPNCFELFSFSFALGPPSLRMGAPGAEEGGNGEGGGGGGAVFSKVWLLKAETALDSTNPFVGQTVCVCVVCVSIVCVCVFVCLCVCVCVCVLTGFDGAVQGLMHAA